jgi:hypothetical protein
MLNKTQLLASLMPLALGVTAAAAQGVGDPIAKAALRCNGSIADVTYPAGSEFVIIKCDGFAPTSSELTGNVADTAEERFTCQPCPTPGTPCELTATEIIPPGVSIALVVCEVAPPPFALHCCQYTYTYDGEVTVSVDCNCPA